MDAQNSAALPSHWKIVDLMGEREGDKALLKGQAQGPGPE